MPIRKTENREKIRDASCGWLDFPGPCSVMNTFHHIIECEQEVDRVC